MDQASAGRPAVRTDFRWAAGGGAAVFVGSLLPFVSVTVASVLGGFSFPQAALTTSAVFGLILAALALGLRAASRQARLWCAILECLLGALGVLVYIGIIIGGYQGRQDNTVVGSITVNWTPGIGIIMAILGCLAVFAGGIKGLAALSKP